MLDITINADQKLYVIPCGNGYSCLGFDYAFERATKVAKWCKCELPHADLVGTIEGFRDYERVMLAGSQYHAATGLRCDAELVPELVNLRHKRVEVTYPDGTKTRFYVGKSTGWLPCHLEIKRRDSSGGGAVYFPQGASVREVK